MPSHELIGEIAGVLAFLPCPIYVFTMVYGETRPDRVTWWILALVSGMITLSYSASGAHETIWLPLGYTLSFLTVALFSLKYGDGPITLHVLDRVSLFGALVSALIWWVLKSPVPSLFMNMTTELIGLAPTYHKAFLRPSSENKLAWGITLVASALNLFAIPEWTGIIAAYPVYVFATNAAMFALLMIRRPV